MIYFVDEDYPAFESWMAELRFRDFEVKPIRSADVAFSRLWNASRDEIDLTIIDVMLAVEDADHPQFSAERSNNYHITGLLLLDDLVAQNPNVFPSRAVLLTNTISDSIAREAVKSANRYDVPLWDKRKIASPVHFGDMVQGLLGSEQAEGT